ncbi:MAG: terminase [Verrucomicrobiae bacterium]|nr:terminase [Verrucomicrobiae bacterium]
MARKRIGNQNPTQSLFLPFRKSLYKEAVALYEKSKRKARKWQILLLKPMMAVNSKGLWVHTKFGYSIPRRNGKNEVVAMREQYGLEKGEQILHTAHRTTTSHTAWERLMRILDEAGIEYNSLRASGRERIEIPETGGRIEFRTRTGSGGLGEGFDLLVIDEAQEYEADQESALKYTVTDSKNPQTIFCGTPPTPVSSGTIFPALRKAALFGESRNTGWAEWSVEDESDPWDKELWYQTNPSLGIQFTERSVSDEIGTDIIDFNIQRLGLWIKYNQKSAISKTDWENIKVPKLPELAGKLFVGVKYGNDGENVAVSIAAKTTDNRIFVEALDCQTIRNGNDWILKFLTSADIQTVVVDGAGGQALLAKDMKDARLKPPILPTVREVIMANAAFEKAIYQETMCHKGQPSLEQVVTNCDKRTIGTNGGFGYRSQLQDYDIALMDSALLAHWACLEAKPIVKQKIRY